MEQETMLRDRFGSEESPIDYTIDSDNFEQQQMAIKNASERDKAAGWVMDDYDLYAAENNTLFFRGSLSLLGIQRNEDANT